MSSSSSSSSVRYLSRRCFSTSTTAAVLEKFKYRLSVRTEFYPPCRPLARAILYSPKHDKIAEEVIRLQPMGCPVLVEASSIEQCRAWVFHHFRFVRFLQIESGCQEAVDFLNSDKILKMKQSMAKRAAGGGGIFQYYFNPAAGSRGVGGGGGGPIVPYALKEEETEENKEASEGESDD